MPATRSKRSVRTALPQPPAILEQRIGHSFRNPGLLAEALTHPSRQAENDRPDVAAHNQRLEFLGDSVLNLILSETLFSAFPEAREGDLSRYRASLINGPLLAGLARDLQLGRYIRLGRGEEDTGGRDRDNLLEDAFEALIGALYLDAGFDTTRRLVLDWYGDIKGRIEENEKTANPKGRLQEKIQALSAEHSPEYHVVGTQGPSHQRRFDVEVRFGESVLGKGSGTSKKEAESRAAESALRNWDRIPPST